MGTTGRHRLAGERPLPARGRAFHVGRSVERGLERDAGQIGDGQQVGRPVGDGDHPPATRPRRAPINSGVEDAEVALDGRGRWPICNWMLRPRGLSMEHPRAEARSPRLKPRAPDWLLPGDLPEGPDARACASSVVTYRPTGGQFDWTDAHRTSVPPSVSPSASGLILLARRDYATALSVTATSRSRARIGGDVAPHGSRWAAG